MKARLPTATARPSTVAVTPFAVVSIASSDRGTAMPRRDRAVDGRGGEGVRRVRFDGCRESQQFVRAERALGADAHEAGFAAGEGSGLVEGERAAAMQFLECGAAPDDDAVAGGAAHSRHERDRGGDDQRARCGDDEHLGEPDRVAGQPPCESGDRVCGEREGQGETVGEPDDRSLAVRGALDEGHDLLILAVLRGAFDVEDDGRGPVDGAAEHLVAG